uniref:Sialate O-acetylesterase domain-containing protein n=1 Tax=Chenopodium quinoa TaxID=63459 RepID=A0A803NAJ4_CHEQI
MANRSIGLIYWDMRTMSEEDDDTIKVPRNEVFDYPPEPPSTLSDYILDETDEGSENNASGSKQGSSQSDAAPGGSEAGSRLSASNEEFEGSKVMATSSAAAEEAASEERSGGETSTSQEDFSPYFTHITANTQRAMEGQNRPLVPSQPSQKLQKQMVDDFKTPGKSRKHVVHKPPITSGEGRYIEEVRQAQMGVDLLNLVTVDAKGLPLEPDNLHLTTQAQVELGEKLAHTFLQFLPGHVQNGTGSYHPSASPAAISSVLMRNRVGCRLMNHFVDIDLNKTCGIGPGIAFANAVESLGGSSKFGFMGLVPCAVGGTKISQWERGTNLYNQLITRAKAATLGGGRTRAVLWYQGEADTVKLEDAKAYRGRMENFISDLRSDLGDPSLLIIQVINLVN